MKKKLALTIGLLCGMQSGFAETTLSTVSGAWYDPSYDGIGFNMAEFSNGLYAYFYGYKSGTDGDSNGEAQWMLTETGISTPIVVGQTYQVNMRSGFVGNGGTFTTAPTTDTSGTIYWGTMELTFNSCNAGVALLNGTDGTITLNIIKLAAIEGLTCETSDSDDSSSSSSDISSIVTTAEAFLATLDSTKLAEAQQDYSVAVAKDWTNLPWTSTRYGLSFGNMTDAQSTAAKALLEAITGTDDNEGWDEIEQTFNADDYLSTIDGPVYGSDNYYLLIMGTPSTTGLWEVKLGGHHFLLSNTYENGELTGATPSFRGVEPMATFTYNDRSNQPLQQEEAAFAAMLQSLSTSELASAELSGTWTDILLGPDEDDSFPTTYSGLKVSNLSDAQKTLVMTAIKTYVNDISSNEVADILANYEDELDETYIAYSGTTNVDTVYDYVRIHGPSVWIEYNVQNGVVLSDPHPHSIWRDVDQDYGGN